MTQENLNNIIVEYYAEFENLKTYFGTWNSDSVEEAFQDAYISTLNNAKSIQGDDYKSVIKYFRIAMSNKLKTYNRNGSYYQPTVFTDAVDEENPNPDQMVLEVEDEQPAISSIDMDLIKKSLSPREWYLVEQIIFDERPAYAVADELNTSKYLINAEVQKALGKVEKILL